MNRKLFILVVSILGFAQSGRMVMDNPGRINARWTAAGVAIAYSGVKGLNEEEEPEVKQQEAVKVK